jgi:hypothetical protein
MFIEWKTTGSQNNFWIIVQKEDDNLEDHLRDYQTIWQLRPKQATLT